MYRYEFVTSILSRQLERELNAAKKELEESREQLNAVRWALKQLDAIYRADCDEPGYRPEWLERALHGHNSGLNGPPSSNGSA